MILKMVIEYDTATNLLKLASPKNTVLCYGMLERAKDLIRKSAEKEQESNIIPVTLMPGSGM